MPLDAAMFELQRTEADALAGHLNRHLGERGFAFHPLQPERWYLRAEAPLGKDAPPLAAARGKPVDVHPGAGAEEARLHALANEIQMLLHDHPVNEAREQRGEPPINAVWLWGGGRLERPGGRPFQRVRGQEPLAAGLALASGAAVLPLPDDAGRWLRGSGNDGVELLVIDALRAPAAYGDAATWRERLAGSSATGSRRSPTRSGRGGSGWSRCTRSGRRAPSTSRRPGRTSVISGGGHGRSRATLEPQPHRHAEGPARRGAHARRRRRASAACAPVREPRREAPPSSTAISARSSRPELKNAEAAAQLLADHIATGRRLVIVADYDCDGATACAVGLRALSAFGASVDYFVPNRFETGYGLSREVVDLVAPARPDLLITVDNGIASVDGVARARELGIGTLITDHHLPGDELPAAECIVNPSQPGCTFPSKSIAGVGVMFYVMLALRASCGAAAGSGKSEPNLAHLLDLVALGTVADVVRLDRNNRILVSQGVRRMRAGQMQPGIAALFGVAGRDPRRAGSFDLGFAVGPRVNAAGRLADMRVGIEALATDDYARALNIAGELDRLNRERREVEESMRRDADALVSGIAVGSHEPGPL